MESFSVWDSVFDLGVMVLHRRVAVALVVEICPSLSGQEAFEEKLWSPFPVS